MNRWRVGEDRGSKETDGCPLTDAALGVWVNNSDSLVFIGEVLDCRLGEDVEGST
jgi:hypothetical protein